MVYGIGKNTGTNIEDVNLKEAFIDGYYNTIN
jgi:hypothetical protein